MRILALNYEHPPLGGGAGNATAHICRELVGLGCEVAVLTSRFHGLAARETVDGYELYRVPVLRRRLDQSTPVEMASFVFSAMVPALQLARRFRPDVLHVYFSVPTGPVGVLVKRLTGTPYLLSLRGGDVPGFLPDTLGRLHRLTAPVNRLVWRESGAIVANSEGLQRLAQRAAGSRQVHMAPNGVDLDTYRPGQRPEHGVFRVLFVGRLVEQKGARYVLEAVALLRTKVDRPIEVVLVGAGPEEPALRRLAQELGLGDTVRFAGWAARHEMPGHYRNADAFVFPSFEEGMPNAVLEAMASGLPIITTDIYGNRDLFTSEDQGFLVPTADANSIAEILRRLIVDPDLRRFAGQQARARAAAFGWRNTAATYLQLSRAILQALERATAVAR